MNNLNAINNSQQAAQVLSSDSLDDKLEGNSQKKIAEALLNESENYSSDSNQKKELAHQYFLAANALEKMAEAVRIKADQLRNNEISKEKAVDEITEVAGVVLQMPVPKDATPELLDQIANTLEEKAKENKMKADEFLIQSERSFEMSKKLKEQAGIIGEKDISLSDIRLKSARFHNEGLKMVFDKLGIFQLDSEYKQQVAYAEKKAQEQGRLGY